MSNQGTIRAPLPARGKRGTLSVCMIVKNEEDNIARAINSFQSFADEIIVNDTGSTDRTLEIVRGLPKTKVIQSEWIGDFSYSRNLSLDAASCAWCLWMDADDYVPPDQAEHFLKLKTAPLDRIFAFQICNTLNGMPVGVRFIQPRMFPNHPKLRFVGKVHEQIAISADRMGLHFFNLDTAIWHLGYETLELRKKKALRNLELQLNDPEHDKTPTGLLQLGDSYSILENYPQAIAFYTRAFEFPDCEHVQPDVYRTVSDNIGRQYLHMKQYAEAESWFRKSEALSPGRLDPIFYRADLYRQTDRAEEAQQLYEHVLSMQVKLTTTGTRHDIIRMHCYKYICEHCEQNALYERMRTFAERFHQEYPETLEGHYFLGLAQLRLNQPERAADILTKAYDKNPQFSRELLLALAEAYHRSGNEKGLARIKASLQDVAPPLTTPAASPGRSPLVSLCMIVKNEEGNLKDCLASVQGLVDEMIIVDTGSTDRTIEIARQCGARVEHFAWIQDFAAARNYSIAFAQGRWILWLDADDRVPTATVQALRAKLEQEPPAKAFALAVKNTTDNGRTGTRFDQIRIFPNNRGVQFAGRIHEQLIESLDAQSIPQQALPLEVYHTGYTDPAVIAAKQRRNLEIFRAQFPDEEKMNALDMFHYAIAHENTGNTEAALLWMRNALALARRRNEYEPLQTMIPAKIATLLANQGQTTEALQIVNESLERFPRYEESILLKAQLLNNTGRAQEAIRWFGYCSLFIPHNSPLPLDFKAMRIAGFQNLAEYWNGHGQADLALALLRLAKQIAEGQEPAVLETAEWYFEYELYKEAVENLEFARPLCEDSEVFCLLLGKSLALAGKMDEAKQWVEYARKKWPAYEELESLAAILS